MKRMLLVIAILMVATSAFAAGWQRSIQVEWGYTPPSDPDVAGYVLYLEGQKVCQFPGATTTKGVCEVSLLKRVSSITLTALFDDDTESPHSSPFQLTDAPAPGLKSVIIVFK